MSAFAVSIPVFANLAGSGFDAGDANLVVNDEASDWVNAPNFGFTIDKLKGQGDDAMGNGTSEDTAVPSLVTDGIPPNKSDITRFYVGSETVTSPTLKNFLYLAWERIVDPSGTTNFDFELNQSETLSSNGTTPVRTAGDILIKYDLASGGSNPSLGWHRWITGGGSANALCEANSKFPCWDKVHAIDNDDFEASINSASAVLDPILPDGGPNPATEGTNPRARTLSVNTFGEAAIDLVGSGILQSDDCTPFASAYLKSRSSDAFNSAIKDFAAPVDVDLNTCGTLNVTKYIDANENGAFDSNTDHANLVFGDRGGWAFSVTGPDSFSCTGTTTAGGALNGGTCTSAVLSSLPPGQYTITETGPATKKIGTGGAFDWLNTDPGGTAPYSETATVTAGGTTSRDFGNTCFATANFEVTGVPSGVGPMSVSYTRTRNSVTSSASTVALTGTGSTRTASVGGATTGLRKGDSIAWSFSIDNQAGSISGTTFTLGGYPGCSGAGSGQFASPDVTAFKYRDLNADGTRQTSNPVEPGQDGFSFELRKLVNNVEQSNPATAQSDANGDVKFTSVLPGTYRVYEVNVPTGWLRTEPASQAYRQVTVNLGDASPVYAGAFGNTPLSRIAVDFTSLGKNPGTTRDATKATAITCSDSASTPNQLGTTATNGLAVTNLTLPKSTVTCTITYVNNP